MIRAGLLRTILTGLLAVILAYAGLVKVNDPAPVSDFLVELISYRLVGIGRAIGFLEIGLALWLLCGVARHLAATFAATLFVGFAVAHGYASMAGVDSPCGCMGKGNMFADMPAWGWVTINIALASVAVVLSAVPKGRSLADDDVRISMARKEVSP